MRLWSTPGERLSGFIPSNPNSRGGAKWVFVGGTDGDACFFTLRNRPMLTIVSLFGRAMQIEETSIRFVKFRRTVRKFLPSPGSRSR